MNPAEKALVCLLSLLVHALVVPASPILLYPRNDAFGPALVELGDFPHSAPDSLAFNEMFPMRQLRAVVKRNIAIGRGDGFRPGK